MCRCHQEQRQDARLALRDARRAQKPRKVGPTTANPRPEQGANKFKGNGARLESESAATKPKAKSKAKKNGGPPSARKRRTQKPRKVGPTTANPRLEQGANKFKGNGARLDNESAATKTKAKQRRTAAHLPPENGGRKNREGWALQRQIHAPNRARTNSKATA
jgi:hypothetical protein